MILFVHIVRQEADTEKSGQLGDQLVIGTLKKNHSSQRNQHSQRARACYRIFLESFLRTH